MNTTRLVHSLNGLALAVITFILAGAMASAANAFLVTAIMEDGMTIGRVTATLAACTKA